MEEDCTWLRFSNCWMMTANGKPGPRSLTHPSKGDCGEGSEGHLLHPSLILISECWTNSVRESEPFGQMSWGASADLVNEVFLSQSGRDPLRGPLSCWAKWGGGRTGC